MERETDAQSPRVAHSPHFFCHGSATYSPPTMAHLHHRTVSGTHRVAMASDYASSSQPRSSTPSLMPSLRFRSPKSRPVRLTLALALAATALWWYSGRQLPFAAHRWRYLPDDASRPPSVHSTIFDKIDALARLDDGADDIDDASQASPDIDPPPGDNVINFDDEVPRVAKLPEVLRYPKQPQSQPVLPQLLPADKLDAVTCPGRAAAGLPCAFLLPGFVGEQETKAQGHLHQLALLAMHLNRTLVLPQVSKSRMGTCYSYPFSLYYQPDSLEQLGIPTIPYKDFLAWSQRRDPAPSAQIVGVMSPKPSYEDGAIEIDQTAPPESMPSNPDRAFCLKKGATRLDWGRYSPLTIWGPSKFWSSQEASIKFGHSIIKTLLGDRALKGSWRSLPERGSLLDSDPVAPDVVVMDYEIRYPVFDIDEVPTTNALSVPLSKFTHFDYGSTWTALADLIVEQLSPFVAVHWRQETLDPTVLGDCGELLVDHLVELKKQWPDIERFYLATDYPIEDLESGREGTSAHSGTFNKILTAQHHIAMRRFLKKVALRVQDQTGLKMTTFSKEQALLTLPSHILQDLANGSPSSATTSSSFRGKSFDAISGGVGGSQESKNALSPIDLSDLDTGLLGIIDKGVAMRAPIFVTGQPGRCSKESSFTRQIIKTREAKFEAAKSGNSVTELRNVADLWTV